MNRLISNTELLIPKKKHRPVDSPVVAGLQGEINEELQREHPSETFIVAKVSEIATQLYSESNAKAMIAAQVAKKRAMLMHPQEFFNCDYFTDLIDTVYLGEAGRVTLLTKTDTSISEGDPANGSNKNPEEEGYGN